MQETLLNNVRIVKKGRTVEKLLANMKGKIEVEVGHFDDQGTHASGYSYPELMAFHNKDSGYDNEHVPPRPILEVTKFRVNGTYKQVFRGMHHIFKDGYSKASLKEYMLKVGDKIKNIELSVFGNSIFLPANQASTAAAKGRNEPMVETGDLQDHVEVRVKTK